MRWDEHGWDNYGPATMWDVAGGVDASGKIVALDATSFGMGVLQQDADRVAWSARPMTTPGNGPADTTYSGTQYNIPNRRIIGKTTPTLNNAFKTSTLRAPNAMQTCFASEQVIDQLAYLAGKDPYQFRLDNITDAAIDRRPVAVARRARRRRAGRELDSRGWRTRSSRPATSARVAASRSAASPARSPASWPRSR